MVHMFTHLGDKDAIRAEIAQGADKTLGLIGDVEQDSAMLASEDNDFLIRMGVSRKLLTDVMYKQKAIAAARMTRSTRRCLTRRNAEIQRRQRPIRGRPTVAARRRFMILWTHR